MSGRRPAGEGAGPEPPGWGGPAVEERAELQALRDQADRAASGAADTLAELTERLSPRNLVSPRRLATRLIRQLPADNRALRLAAVALPMAAVLAALAALAAARRNGAAGRR